MYSSNISISKRFAMSVVWNIFMYSFMLCQLNIHNIVKEPDRANLPGTSKLSAFVWELLILVRHTLTNKKSRKLETSKILRCIA